jgi:hypothetical protein
MSWLIVGIVCLPARAAFNGSACCGPDPRAKRNRAIRPGSGMTLSPEDHDIDLREATRAAVVHL